MTKPYKKDCDYSYTLGFYPSFELARYHPEWALSLLFDSRAQNTDGAIKLCQALAKIPSKVDDKEFSKLSTKDNDHVAVIFKKATLALDTAAPHIVLVNPSDQGNLGNIMRSMAAFSYRDLAIITPAADRFNPKVIRASMGSFFFLRQECFSSFEEYKKCYPRRFYPFMLPAKKGLKELEVEPPYSLIFGNEATGLPASFLSDSAVRIEQPGDVDSLNLPTAVAIALYETRVRNP